MTAAPRHRWLACGLVAVLLPVVLIVWRRSLPEAQHLSFLAHLLYWTMPVVLFLWVAAGVRLLRASTNGVGSLLRRHGPGLLLAIALTATIVLLLPPTMRVQFDETCLVGASQNMHIQRAALMTTAALPFEGELLRLENMVDKRPPLFAFVVSLLHDVTGQRIGNAFAVNAALLVVLFTFVHAAARRWLDAASALAAPLLLASVPLVAVVAMSAGFELLSAVLLLQLLLATLGFVDRPEPARLSWLVACGLLFTQARYESVVVLAVLVPVVLWQVRGRWRGDAGTAWLLALAPGLLTPLAFLLQHAQKANFYPEAAGRPLVALAYAIENLPRFLGAFFDLGLQHVWPGALGGLGVVGYVVWRWRVRQWATDLLVVLPVFTATAIVLVWFFGDVKDPIAWRLFLPAAVLGALGPLLWQRVLGARLPALVLVAMAALFAGGRLALVARDPVFPRVDAAKLTEGLDAALLQLGTSPGDTLWVTVAAQYLIVKGHAALAPEAFVRHYTRQGGRPSMLDELRARGHVKTILLVETALDLPFAPAFGDMRTLLAAAPADVVGRFDAGLPIVVHRLRP